MNSFTYMKIGVLCNGIFWQELCYRTLGTKCEMINIYRGSFDINDYDIVIVSKGVHQQFLVDNVDTFVDFYHSGGVLISFGEHNGNWIPGTVWELGETGKRVKLIKDKELQRMGIFFETTDEEIHSWPNVVHGFFEKIPEEAKKLAIVEGHEEKVIAFVYDRRFDNSRVGAKGVLLAMTMDPDYHTYAMIPFAAEMLRTILDWANREALYRRKERENRFLLIAKKMAKTTRTLLRPRNLIIEIIGGFVVSIILYVLGIP